MNDNTTLTGDVSLATIRTLNKKVACEPFPEMAVEKETRGGMVVPKQRGALTKLRVVFGDDGDFYCGSFIWVRSESFIQQWAKDVYELDGKRFILVPADAILLIQ